MGNELGQFLDADLSFHSNGRMTVAHVFISMEFKEGLEETSYNEGK